MIAILAQIGSFVPATTAKIGLVDAVYSRVGAWDDIGRGQSTFMVEMLESAEILKYATGTPSLVPPTSTLNLIRVLLKPLDSSFLLIHLGFVDLLLCSPFWFFFDTLL